MFLNKNSSSAFFLSILEYLGSNFLFIFSKENPFLYISSILLKACLSRNVKLILFLLWLKEPRTTRCICHFGVKSPFGNSVAVLLSVFPYTFGFQLPENVIYTRPLSASWWNTQRHPMSNIISFVVVITFPILIIPKLSYFPFSILSITKNITTSIIISMLTPTFR